MRKASAGNKEAGLVVLLAGLVVIAAAGAAWARMDSPAMRTAQRARTLAYLGAVGGESSNPFYAIFVVDAHGSRRRRLTGALDPDWLEWSPDGRRLVFATDKARPNAIWAMEGDGSRRRRLKRSVEPRGYRLSRPTWSPDGMEIVYSVWDVREGNSIGIYLLNAEGKRSRRLTRGDDEFVSWSPDRRQIAFVRVAHPPNALTRPFLYVMNRDGTNQRKLLGPLGHSDYFALAPDWGAVAVARERGASNAFDVHLSTPGGAQARRVGRSSGTPEISWAPDSRAVAFDINSGRGTSIWIVRADPNRRRQVIRNARNPVWSPGGDQIAAFAGGGLSVMRTDGRNRRLIVPLRNEIRNVRWAPTPRR